MQHLRPRLPPCIRLRLEGSSRDDLAYAFKNPPTVSQASGTPSDPPALSHQGAPEQASTVKEEPL
eukprot:1141807-Pelagomonas_calceolata.AAC.3